VSREYLAEVRVTLPQGKTLDDWGDVGHLFVDLRDDRLSLDLLKLGHKINKSISEFERKEDANGVHSITAVPN
jgi:hypothetical protein